MNEKRKNRCETCECYDCDMEECNCECHDEQVAEKGNDWVCACVYDGNKSSRPNTNLPRYR